jgi:hypothetical protein
VHVRDRPFVVVDAKASVLPDGVVNGTQHFVQLSSVEDDALGEELEIIWELEPGAVCMERSSLPNVTAFDEPRKLDAFLDAVRWGAVCRYLSARLVEAWTEVERAYPDAFITSPEADLSTGGPSEALLARLPDDERLHLAARAIADRCLYGVDINPMAVEMAKLSLWLPTSAGPHAGCTRTRRAMRLHAGTAES